MDILSEIRKGPQSTKRTSVRGSFFTCLHYLSFLFSCRDAPSYRWSPPMRMSFCPGSIFTLLVLPCPLPMQGLEDIQDVEIVHQDVQGSQQYCDGNQPGNHLDDPVSCFCSLFHISLLL